MYLVSTASPTTSTKHHCHHHYHCNRNHNNYGNVGYCSAIILYFVVRHSKGPLVLLFGLFVDSLFVSLSNYLRNWTQANKRPKTLCTQCAQLTDTHYFVLYIQSLCLVLQLTSIRKKLRVRKEVNRSCSTNSLYNLRIPCGIDVPPTGYIQNSVTLFVAYAN